MSPSTSLDGRPRIGPALAIIAVLMAAVVAVQVVRDRGWTPYAPEDSVLWLRSGEAARRLALSFDDIVADTYWIRAVIYYGGQRRTEARRSYEELYPLLDLVTSLDPHFKVAYRFGALFLSEPLPGGPGRTDQAVALLQRGIERDFRKWEYFHDIGFIYYWWVRDYAKAADWFLRGSEEPGAAGWLKPLAATTLATGGSRETSRQLWRQLLDSDMEYIKGQAELRLQQLDAMDTIAELTLVLQRFIAREHRTPNSWEELAQAERLPRVPTDPTGVRFVFDPKVGHIDVSRKSSLWPLPSEPTRLPAPPR